MELRILGLMELRIFADGIEDFSLMEMRFLPMEWMIIEDKCILI